MSSNDDECVIVAPSTVFPKRCVTCGTAKKTKRHRQSFVQERPAARIGATAGIAIFGAIPGILLASVLGSAMPGPVAAEVSYCEACWDERFRKGALTSFGGILSGVFLIATGTAAFNGAPRLAVLPAVLAVATGWWALRLALARKNLEVVRMVGASAWVRGIHPRVREKMSAMDRAPLPK